jgi:putative transposase
MLARKKRYLIIDRDTKYSEQFRWLIRDEGTKVIRPPPRSPNLNAYAERFVRWLCQVAAGCDAMYR